MRVIKKIALYFARKEFCKKAIIERIDFNDLKKKHTGPVVIGLILIIFSYVSVIPAFFLIGLIAAILKKPIIGVIGIPLAYGLSWLLLMLGMYLTGPEYARSLGGCAVRIILEKILGDDVNMIRSLHAKEPANEIE